MGQCPCWGSRKRNSYNPFIYDEDYQEFDSSRNKGSFSTYRPPVAPTPSHTGPVNSTPSTKPAQSSATYTYQPSESHTPSSQSLEPHSQEPPQYTQFTESVFLSRPNQPTDSMMMDSMMGSTILGNQEDSTILGSNSDISTSPSSTPATSVYYDASSSSFMANSVHPGAFEPPTETHPTP